ncbi:MAG: HD domain-containing phosphohydrolase [Campylobacterota bacterium]|nr:HD domain-containing phosphohydrolase [Campylobacterota bacterium]
MDKKKQMNFNLNNFLLSVSDILDFRDIEKNNTTKHHSKRVAYIALKIGEQLNLDPKQMFALCAYSLFHNYIDKENCITLGVYDDMGILTKIVNYSHNIDETYRKDKIFIPSKEILPTYKQFDEIFLEISKPQYFWLDLQNEGSILQYIYSTLYDMTTQPTYEDVLNITSIFGNLYEDTKPFLEKCEKMTDFYQFDYKDKITFLIAASLINFGKLNISSKLLEKKEKITKIELEEIKSNVYYNQKALQNIYEFENISRWATIHQEKLDSNGYPFCLKASQLSLKDRLMGCLNIYNSLISNKAYRDAYSHQKAIEIMKELGQKEEIDLSIVNNIASIFE